MYTHCLHEVAELTNGNMSLFKNPVRTFEGEVIVPKTALASGYLKDQVSEFNKRKYAIYAIWVLGILSAVALFTVIKFRKEWVTNTRLNARYDKLKIDVKAGLFFLSILITTGMIYPNARNQTITSKSIRQIYLVQISWLVIFAVAIAAISFQLVNCVERWKHKGVLEQDIANSYVLKFLGRCKKCSWVKQLVLKRSFCLLYFFLLELVSLECSFDPLICSRLCNMCRVLGITSALYFHETLSILEPNYYSYRKDGTWTSTRRNQDRREITIS